MTREERHRLKMFYKLYTRRASLTRVRRAQRAYEKVKTEEPFVNLPATTEKGVAF